MFGNGGGGGAGFDRAGIVHKLYCMFIDAFFFSLKPCYSIPHYRCSIFHEAFGCSEPNLKDFLFTQSMDITKLNNFYV